MCDPVVDPKSNASRCRTFFACIVGTVALATNPAWAQYAFDPSAADEQMHGIKYFGAAKDEKGSLIPGVTILLSASQTSFVFVTDDAGRFRGILPVDALPGNFSPKCSKAGFQFVKATKRPGLDGPKPYVQVDCVLRSTNSR